MKLVPHVKKLIRSSAKCRNLFLIFKTPKLGSAALRLKLTHSAVSCQTIIGSQPHEAFDIPFHYIMKKNPCSTLVNCALINVYLKDTKTL